MLINARFPGSMGINPEFDRSSSYSRRMASGMPWSISQVGELFDEKRRVEIVNGKKVTHYDVVARVPVWIAANAAKSAFVVWLSGLEVDHDGGTTYHPPVPGHPDGQGPNLGTDALLCASATSSTAYDRGNPDKLINGKRWDHKSNTAWVSIALKSDGYPYVQSSSDPNPGFYVTTTSLADRSVASVFNPRRYVDATRIPYVVLYKQIGALGVKQGDFCTVVIKSGTDLRAVHAIIADAKGFGHGEASQALHDSFRGPGRRSGFAGDVIVLFYPGSRDQKVFSKDWTQADITSRALRHYMEFGGENKVRELLPQMAVFKK